MVYFGDRRLDRRYIELKSSMVRRCSVIIRQLATDRNEEIGYGRFLRHQKVSMSNMLSSAYAHTREACANRHILLVQDTSALGFGLNPKAGLMGPISADKSRGFYVHPVICIDALQGSCLGLSCVELNQREDDSGNAQRPSLKERKRLIRLKSFEDKESYRWWSSIESSIKQIHTASKHTVIADSESDIYDLMVKLDEHAIDFVLRSFQNRTLNTHRSGYKLADHLTKEEVKASYKINLPATDKRSAHRAQLEVKWCPVNLARPHETQNKELPANLRVNIVEVSEMASSVVGNEKPVYWRLITSHPIDSFEQVLQIIKWYTWRWVIEQLFRTIKRKGLNIQQAQVESEHALKNLTTLALISAVQVMQLVQARDGQNDLLIRHVFTRKEQEMLNKINPSLEGRTIKLKNPHPPDSLAFACWIIARLGGWSGYRSQRPPGPITMANGLKRFREAIYFAQFFPN